MIVSIGLFMVVLDNLVVNVALPSIHRDLGASIQSLEWTVNAYVLSYAVLLLTGAALGDRFGRKRMFIAGIALFTVASAAAALAPIERTADRRPRAPGRRRRDRHAADADAAGRGVPAGAARAGDRRLVGDQRDRGRARPARRRRRDPAQPRGTGSSGSTSRSASILAPLAVRRLDESYGPTGSSTCPGSALASTGLFGLVFGLIRAQTIGWGALEVLISLAPEWCW